MELLGVTLEVGWEAPAVIGGAVAGVLYLGTRIRRLVQALDRWDHLPALFDDVAAIKTQVVPDDATDRPPLHERVERLEGEVALIKAQMATSAQLDAHTEQDAGNFSAIEQSLTRLEAHDGRDHPGQ